MTSAEQKRTAGGRADDRSLAVRAAIDIGNGYVKAAADDVPSIDLPSVTAVVMGRNRLPLPDKRAGEWAAGDVYNGLDASFESALVNDRERHILGEAALSTDGSLEQFAIDAGTGQSKSAQPLNYELIYGVVAATALRRWVLAHDGRLPDGELDVSLSVAVTLPIAEYEQRRGAYRANLAEKAALVTVHNFATPVVVRISAASPEDVKVVAEGASAQLALTSHGTPLMGLLLKDAEAHGVPVEGYGPEDVLKAGNIIGIDIGEGTVNFPVFTNGAYNPGASATLPYGYGSVLEAAIRDMDDEGFQSGYTSRKQLADDLLHEPLPMKREFRKRVEGYVARERRFLAGHITAEFNRLTGLVGSRNEVAYVYGGGASAMKDDLYRQLIDKARSLGFPVLYMDSRYSRVLNREGLAIAVGLRG